MSKPKITPEMISDDLYRNVCVSPRSAYAHDLNVALDDPTIRAMFVARAVELGEASPAVYVLRDTIDGRLHGPRYSGRPELFMGDYIHPAHEVLEHWKGQTE